MDAQELRKLQIAQLDIMDEVHRICEKNAIPYYLIGGTALGAKRHEGFIPWDLDIDVALTRENYKRFKEICEIDLNERFVYHDYLNTKKYSRPHALMCIKNTFLSIRHAEFNSKEENLGIYIDIFPLDNAPNDTKQRIKHANSLSKLRKMKKFKFARRGSNNFIKNFIRDFISGSMFWTDIDQINEKFDHERQRYNNDETQCYCIMSGHYPYERECIPKDVLGTPKLMKFENRYYYVPEHIEEYLTLVYGDFMQLPPENMRQANYSCFEKVVFDEQFLLTRGETE